MMNTNLIKIIVPFCMMAAINSGLSNTAQTPKLHRFSTTVEKERPELDEETKRLIATYKRNPSASSRQALKKQVEKNYDKVLGRKKAKLEELKRTAKHLSKVQEMQDIVDEMVRDRNTRIEQSMSRFTDSRLKPGVRETNDGYLPVLGASQNVFIAYTPVSNEDYSQFLKETGRKAPKDWKNGSMPKDKQRHPVVHVSYEDAIAYCKWLSNKDKTSIYRLPTEEEWELAAGHMPKDADFNCGERNGTSPVDAYAKTKGACGAIDFWGNCWEWTSTPITSNKKAEIKTSMMSIKGGSWSSPRNSCRTERKGEGRDASSSFADVSFRVIREQQRRPQSSMTK